MMRKIERVSLEKSVIKEYIETLGDIKVKYLPRSQYVFLGTNILKGGILYLPDDLSQGDFLSIVKNIHNYYHIHSETLEVIKSKTKILSNILLKIGGNDIEGLHEIPYSQVKNVIQEIKKMTSRNLRDFDEVDKIMISRYVQNYLSKEFFKELYEVGNQNLKRKLKTLTLEEKRKIEDRKTLRKNGEFIRFKGVHQYLDIEQNFREYLGIDDMIETLDKFRKNGHTEEEQKYAKQCLENIFQAMNLYPYQLTTENNGYKIQAIIQKKEIYCVGFTLILHSLLQDLGIEHEGIDIQSHVATKITIGNQSYFFDNVILDKIIPYQVKTIDGEYMYFPDINDYGKTGEVTDVIIGKILLNTGYDFSVAGKLNESIYAFEKSYTFFKSFDALLNIARIYCMQEQYQKGIEMCEKIQGEFGELFPEMLEKLFETWADNLYGLKKYEHALEYFQRIDVSMHPLIHSKIGDCMFHIGDIQGALQYYTKSLRYISDEKLLKKMRLKMYLIKKILKVKTFFEFRYKREKRWIDQNIEREDIFDLVCEF